MTRPLALVYVRRFCVAVVLGVALGLGVVAAVPAASFDDSYPCPADAALLVCPSGEVGKPYTLQLTGKGGCDVYWWEIVNGALPAGLSMTREGLISGTPTTVGEGRFWVVIHDVLAEEGGPAWCAGDNKSEREFLIRIAAGLVVTTDAAPGAFVGRPYTLALGAGMQTAPGQTTPPSTAPTWSVEGELPPGLGLNAETGVISGTPTASGTYSFVVRAALADGRSATKALSIEIMELLAVVPPSEIAPAEVGVPVRIALGATGGRPGYTWSLTGGALPAGIALTAAGVVFGRPLEAGVFRFTATVSDTGGQTATYAGVLRVAARLAIARPVALQRAIVGRAYSTRIVASGGVAPATWTLVGKLPRGLRFDPATATIAGTPRAAGRYRIVVQATDQLGVRARRSYSLIVTPPKER